MVTQLLVRLNRDTTSAFTDTNVNDFLSQAHRWSANFKKWPFPEGRTSTTWASSTEEWNFEGYQAESFRYLEVGGNRFTKLNFEDYKIYREDKSTGQDKVYSNFGGLVFVNPNAIVSGTLTAYGKYMPANFDITDQTGETVFTEGNDEGNQAILEESQSYYYQRANDENKAQYHHNLAVEHLEKLWDKVKAEKALNQTHEVRGGMFKRIDVVEGGMRGDITEDRFF